jgi:hypothetical protein
MNHASRLNEKRSPGIPVPGGCPAASGRASPHGNAWQSMKPFTLALIVTALFLASCKPIEQLPDTPNIIFRSFLVFDTTHSLGSCKAGRLKFYFEDGDGDLGMSAQSGEETETSNLFFTMYRKIGGALIEAADSGDLLKPGNYRIPYMERNGRNKILRGTIDITMLYTFYDVADNDTILYDFTVIDRAGNTSNVARTSEIALSANGLY